MSKTKKTLVNTETEADVDSFIASIEPEKRQKEARQLLKWMKEITQKEPKLWGKRMIAFGKYTYQRKNGDEFEWFNVGFAAGKAHMTLYMMYDLTQEEDMLSKLGPHKIGKGCLYIRNLEKANEGILKEMIAKSDKWQST